MGEIKKHGYSERLFLGTIAAGGTLGILIPPSINMIVYGVLTDSSIPRLYLAGIIPGLVLASLFSLTVLIACLLRPSLGGRRTHVEWRARIRAPAAPIPPPLILLPPIWSRFSRLATPPATPALSPVSPPLAGVP